MAGIIRKGSRVIFARRAAQLQAGLGRITRQIEQETTAKAREGLMLNVYNTAPGNVYERTGLLLATLSGYSQVTGANAHIVLTDTAPYASLVEFGTGPHAMTQQQLDQYLASRPPNGLLTFGRSGQAYLFPGPYISPAIWFAKARMQQEVRDLMRRLWA